MSSNFDLAALIDELIEDPETFFKNHNIDILVKIIKYANDKYFNNTRIMSDKIYDLLYDYVKEKDPNNPIFKQVGAEVLSQNKVKLPYIMGSMEKIKPNNSKMLVKWLNEYDGPYVYSDKLDGISGLLTFSNNKFKFYTRGDGTEGTDISNLINYIPIFQNLDLEKLNDFIKKYKIDSLAVRGEIIMSINKFKKYSKNMANARNMVGGIVNSKTIKPDIVADVDFVVYELINPWINNQSKQWTILESLGFNVVSHFDNLDVKFNNLSTILANRNLLSEYEIDGIIVSNNILPDKRSKSLFPEYAFAFKDPNLLETAEVEVINVEWSISKDGYIKPKLNIVPTKLGGVTISNVTAFNAQFVKNNVLGPGAIISLIRSGDVIPHITGVIQPASTGTPQFPDIPYIWTDTGVDIITTDDTIDQQIKELTFFFKKLDIKNVDESTVRKFIEAGINSIPDILDLKKDDLINVEGFKDKMVTKIFSNISERIKTLTIYDLMIASNVFGHGIGHRKIKKIIDDYPDIIKLYRDYSNEDITNMIKALEGFDTKTAEYFVDGLDRFITLFNHLKPDMRKKLRISIQIHIHDNDIKDDDILDDGPFKDKTFVFSGFRNKSWEQIIESGQGKIGTSISSKVYMLVTTQDDIDKGTNSKIIKATELKITIISKEEFQTLYNLS